MSLSPFSPSSSKPGHGIVHLSLLPPATPTFSTLTYTYPLKLLPSAPHILEPPSSSSLTELPITGVLTPTSVPLLFLLSYGGGLLPPDILSLTLTLSTSTRLVIATQGSTKIFPPPPSLPSATATQFLHASISPNAGLWLAPDPTQPFRGSRYKQKQIFEVEEEGSVGIVDWVCEGRRRRGESWGDIIGWRGGNEVWRIGKKESKKWLILRDNIILEGEGIAARMEGVGIFGTVLLMGSLFKSLGDYFSEEFKVLPRIGGRNWGDATEGEEVSEQEAKRKERWKVEKEDGVLWTAANVRGCVLVKFGAREVEGGRKWLGTMLREEGSVGRDFGEGGLMFVR